MDIDGGEAGLSVLQSDVKLKLSLTNMSKWENERRKRAENGNHACCSLVIGSQGFGGVLPTWLLRRTVSPLTENLFLRSVLINSSRIPVRSSNPDKRNSRDFRRAESSRIRRTPKGR